MLRCLDFKNILIWPGFSHFFSRDFFLETTCAPSGSVCACHVAWNLHYARAHWSLEGAHACHVAWSLKSGSPRQYLLTEEEKNQTKKILKGKSVQWLLGKNSKRHNFTDTEWNHALQRGICSLTQEIPFARPCPDSDTGWSSPDTKTGTIFKKLPGRSEVRQRPASQPGCCHATPSLRENWFQWKTKA